MSSTMLTRPETTLAPAAHSAREPLARAIDLDSVRRRRSRITSTAPPAPTSPSTVLRAETSLATVINLAERRRPRTPQRPMVPADPPRPLPDPTAICCAIVTTAVEVLRGDRPVTQMARWVSPDILGAIHRRTRLTIVASESATKVLPPVTVVRTRTVRIGDRAAEVTVIVKDLERVRAAAIRVEAARGSWHAVALEIG